MSTSGDPTKRHQGFLASRIPDELIDQALAVNESLKPDPNADPITQIDQAWIQESTRYTGMNSSGVIKAPNSKDIRRGALLMAIMSAAAIVGAIVYHKGVLFLPGGCFLFMGILFSFALVQATRYDAAAATYRERRAAALASLGRAAEADAPLPVVDTPVWAAKGTLRLDETLKRLHDEHAFSTVNSADYRQTQVALLNSAPARERPFYEQLNALEYAWAVERRKLTVKRNSRSRWRVPPTAAGAKQSAVSGMLILLVITSIMVVKGAPLIFGLFPLLMAVLVLYGSWSAYQKASRYEQGEAAYLQRRADLLAQRRLDERFS
jgi:uncharacterized membrane protein